MMRLVTSANTLRTQSHALGAGGFDTVHFDDHHKVLGFRREVGHASDPLFTFNVGFDSGFDEEVTPFTLLSVQLDEAL